MARSYSIYADLALPGPVACPPASGVEIVVSSGVEVDLGAVKGKEGLEVGV